mgnify:CR=1 FL=1
MRTPAGLLIVRRRALRRPLLLFHAQIDHEHGNIRGGDARNALRLSEVEGADTLQFLPRFQPKSRDRRIVQIGRQGAFLHFFRLLHLLFAAFQISFVAHFRLAGEFYVGRRVRKDPENFRNARERNAAADEVGVRHAARQRGMPVFLHERVRFFLFRARLQDGRGLFAHGFARKVRPIALLRDKPAGVSDLGQARVGVVLPQRQAVFRARGHHAVGFVRSLRHEVVDEHADIRLIAPQNEGRQSAQFERRVQPRNQSLRRRLFVAARAVDLPRGVQSFHLLEFEGGEHVQRVDAVVFDGVGVSHDLAMFQPLHRAVHLLLQIVGERGGKPLHIHFGGVRALGFEEELVPLLVGKADDLSLDGRAVARSRGGDRSVIEGRAVEVF